MATKRKKLRKFLVTKCLFQKSSPLKLMKGLKLDLATSIFRLLTLKVVLIMAPTKQTWPPLLKIEHRVKMQFYLNSSETKPDIKILAWGKIDQHDKIYLRSNFHGNRITDVGVAGPEMTIFANFRIWSLFLRERKEISDHCKNKSCLA